MDTKVDILEISRKFRAQPIIEASSLKIHGIELLSRAIFSFGHESMVQIDKEAVRNSARLIDLGIFSNVHFNAEVTSIMHPDWVQEAAYRVKKGMVLEIVERNNLLDKKSFLREFCATIEMLRNFGVKVAMDDVGTDRRSLDLIEVINPDIIKIEHPTYIDEIKRNFDAEIVLERIEGKDEARQSLGFGVDYFQGYYYDILFKDSIPACLTPPGVMSMKILESLSSKKRNVQ